ncbi:T9SS type A sorting domain-containing protein [Reichenbachiella agarivorans]|uniref:T9SS type A sorting domain-containing protein n=1 Tax=Reichenbachiella agarivorans TaxID=2979464 RepID=A0ABY6CN01_9BACT|nr:T9SS type A sorting domain-containing protein [Reichenbachiella agarivorans]UXP31886.1 T9SS type A sorting domain-containing protein [Reichenbachiella agarivorans]
MKTKFYLLQFFVLLSSSLLYGQDTVDVNLNIKHVVDGVSEFDRAKYITIHDDVTGSEWESDEQKLSLIEGYDIYFGRNNGTIVWEWNNTKEDPGKVGWPDVDHMKTRGQLAINAYAAETAAHQLEDRYSNMVVGGQEHMFPHGQATSVGGLTYDGFEATAEFYGQYFKEYFGEGGVTGRLRPGLIEVINEPFVKTDQLGTTNLEMSKYHSVVAKRIKELNPNLWVGGYSAAHPAFESNNFSHWNNTWKTFIDEAGADMDFFSFHLYDFIDNTGDITQELHRSGSNIEAIMDMIGHYSYLRLGEVKPFSVSEYGWLCKNCEGGYDPKEDWYNLRSFNTMMVQLMERPDQILNSIPFMLLKASWAKPADAEYNTYGPRLMREVGELPGEEAHDGYIYTYLLQYYQMWAELNGTRVDTWSNEIDMMADAYVDGRVAYVILSNLNEESKTVNLKIKGTTNNPLVKITAQHLYEIDDIPQLDTLVYDVAIDAFELGQQATVIMKYEFENEISLTESLEEQKYYATNYLVPIRPQQSLVFSIPGVNVGDQGEAVLRVGMGRDHGKSLRPALKVNGEMVPVLNDWRGYDQKTRDIFFGVLEIPVPHGLLREKNTVELIFPDEGGHVSSMVLQVFNSSVALDRSEPLVPDIPLSVDGQGLGMQIYPNPTSGQLTINGLADNSPVFVMDLSGKMLSKGKLAGNKLDISGLQSGIYLLQTGQGDQVKRIKVIKE